MQCTRALDYHRSILGVEALDWFRMEVISPTHALHNVRRRLVKNLRHFTIDNNGRALGCNDSTMSGGACTHDSRIDNHSTMSGEGCLSIDTGIESPKHRVSPWTLDELLCT